MQRAYEERQAEARALLERVLDGSTELTDEIWQQMNHLNQDLFIEDSAFASVLNPDGEIQIGSKVFRVTPESVYTVHELDAHLLGQLGGKLQGLRAHPGVDIFPIQSTVKQWEEEVDEYSLGTDGVRGDIFTRNRDSCTSN